jgi:hypothetical protein
MSRRPRYGLCETLGERRTAADHACCGWASAKVFIVDEIRPDVWWGVSELPRPQDSSLGIEVEVAPRWPHCRYLPASTTTVASQHLRLTSKDKAMTIVREDSVTVFINSREVAIEPTTR